jgi:hypothetical protein
MTGACPCLSDPQGRLAPVRGLGMDEQYGEVEILTCEACGQLWVKVLYELEAFTGSGRWYLGAITTEQAETLTAKAALAMLEGWTGISTGGVIMGGGWAGSRRDKPVRVSHQSGQPDWCETNLSGAIYR